MIVVVIGNDGVGIIGLLVNCNGVIVVMVYMIDGDSVNYVNVGIGIIISVLGGGLGMIVFGSGILIMLLLNIGM